MQLRHRMITVLRCNNDLLTVKLILCHEQYHRRSTNNFNAIKSTISSSTRHYLVLRSLSINLGDAFYIVLLPFQLVISSYEEQVHYFWNHILQVCCVNHETSCLKNCNSILHWKESNFTLSIWYCSKSFLYSTCCISLLFLHLQYSQDQDQFCSFHCIRQNSQQRQILPVSHWKKPILPRIMEDATKFYHFVCCTDSGMLRNWTLWLCCTQCPLPAYDFLGLVRFLSQTDGMMEVSSQEWY